MRITQKYLERRTVELGIRTGVDFYLENWCPGRYKLTTNKRSRDASGSCGSASQVESFIDGVKCGYDLANQKQTALLEAQAEKIKSLTQQLLAIRATASI